MSNDVLGYSSHDWRKHTDDAVVVDDKSNCLLYTSDAADE